jgi:hypothetical protein
VKLRFAVLVILLVGSLPHLFIETNSAGARSGLADTTAVVSALSWAPPALSDPITLDIPADQQWAIDLDPARDYIIRIPAAPIQRRRNLYPLARRQS